jgi:uncharacterized protein (DUF1330 family)
MSVYVLAEVYVSDPDQYRLYEQKFPAVFAGCGGVILAKEDCPLRLEGSESPDQIILIAFKDAEQASAFLLSDAFTEISKDREASSRTITHVLRAMDRPFR